MLIKKHIRLLVILVSLVSVNIFAARSFSYEPGIVPTNSSKPIMLKKSPTKFSIILPSNPSAGYTWMLDYYDDTLMNPPEHKFHYPAEAVRLKLTGAPGLDEWIFTTKELGLKNWHTTISLVYMRPWLKEVEQKETFKIVMHHDD